MTTRKSLEQLTKELTVQSFPALKIAIERAEAIKPHIAPMTLGESNRRKTIARACPSLNPYAENSHAELAKLLPMIKIIKRYKRKTLLSIGDLTVVIGKYGVAFYYMPTGIDIDCLSLSMESILDSSVILNHIGAIADGREHGETIYNYARCSLPLPKISA